MPTKQNNHDLEPLLNTHQQQLGLVMAEADSIDSKALALLGAITALLIFIGQADVQLTGKLQWILLVGPQFLALIFTGLAIWPRHYTGPSVNSKELKAYTGLSRDDLILQLLADADQAITIDTGYNQLRWKYCVVSVVLTFLGVIALLVIM